MEYARWCCAIMRLDLFRCFFERMYTVFVACDSRSFLSLHWHLSSRCVRKKDGAENCILTVVHSFHAGPIKNPGQKGIVVCSWTHMHFCLAQQRCWNDLRVNFGTLFFLDKTTTKHSQTQLRQRDVGLRFCRQLVRMMKSLKNFKCRWGP